MTSFYFVTSPAKLALEHKFRELLAPTPGQLQSSSIPADRLYCGNVAWEIIHAKNVLGEGKVRVLQDADLPPNLLPPRLSSAFGLDLFVKSLDKKKEPVRIALLNGFGTMLGDTVLGCGALMALYDELNKLDFNFEFHAFASWNARPGVEKLLDSCPAIQSIQAYSPTLKQLREFDAYIDFSSLLSLSGYGSEYFIDFYIRHLGANPDSIATAKKKPWFLFDPTLLPETKRLVRGKAGRQVVLVHPSASTPLRSMPVEFTKRLVRDIVRTTPFNVAFAVPPGFDIKPFKGRVIDVSAWSSRSLQHLGAIVQAVDQVVSVDTLIIHLANAADKQGVDVLTASMPLQSVPADGRLVGILIPGADKLPGWMTHKALQNWSEIESLYLQAWADLDSSEVVTRLKSPKPH